MKNKQYNKPIYNNKPIGSLESLSSMLGISKSQLDNIINHVSDSYKSFIKETGRNKKSRELFEPKKTLKQIQKKLNKEIFEGITYPNYLHGGIKNKDYITNAKVHSGAKSIISLDIENFYPSIRKNDVLNIFKNLMKFPQDVSESLTKLVTLNGVVPQGSCCSSYIANLVFFNSEYHLVTKVKNKRFEYSRLLDDITISSKTEFTNEEKTFVINNVRAMANRYRLSLNENKTKIENSSDLKSDFEVTGLWAKHSVPKLKKCHRRYIRYIVFICEKQALFDRTSMDYHALWNKASGKVAQLKRLNHSESNMLRDRLSLVLPEYDDDKIQKIIKIADNLLVNGHKLNAIDLKDKINHLFYEFGIVSRTKKSLAYRYRKKIRANFSSITDKVTIS
ncbi:reverse transcriptase family protein [Morganella morganii]|uniref:reverse transcriptase family protein n=1 Tax=Morganella morganii TaxID=582 RepID=UPI001F1C4E71|nr:reverse transcriptase family protein [Morganella morganii]MCF1267339.1 reverse transcriptase family protein [Morganella morganii]